MCMCCVTSCCCRNSPMKTINISLLVLIACSLFFSLLTTIIRSAKTSRYQYDIDYLKNYSIENKNTLSLRYLPNIIKDKNSTFRNLRNYYYYNGKKVYEPESEISHQSLFKKWKKTEIALNLIRFFLFIFHFLISLHFLINRNKSLDLKETILPITIKLSIVSIILCIIQIIYTTILMYLRSMTFITDQEIGGYYEDETTDFADYNSYNVFFDTIIIILIGICLSFSYRIYYNAKYYNGKNIIQINKNGVVQIVQVNPNVQPGFIMVDQNGQYLYAQPIGNNQVPNIMYQGGYNVQGNNFNNNMNNQNNITGNNNNPNYLNEKYNA